MKRTLKKLLSTELEFSEHENNLFEAYLKGHCWASSHFIEGTKTYANLTIHLLWGSWQAKAFLLGDSNDCTIEQALELGKYGAAPLDSEYAYFEKFLKLKNNYNFNFTKHEKGYYIDDLVRICWAVWRDRHALKGFKHA